MSCEIGTPIGRANLYDVLNYNGFSTQQLHHVKQSKRGSDSRHIKAPENHQTFKFRPISPPARSSLIQRNNPTKRPCRTSKLNWSADRMFFGVKSSIEKIRLQDRIDYSESLRKIPKRSYVTLLSGDLLEWKKSINEHNIVWKRQVIKNFYHPPLESFVEADEFVLEPEDNLYLYEEEDCF